MTWQRPELKVRAPNRSIGGLYRAGPGQEGAQPPSGIPFRTTEDAVVGAIFAGYQIADAQIANGVKIAMKLRGAAKQHGIEEPKDVLTTAETLARRGALFLLRWLVSDPSSPLKNVLSAEHLLGALAGLDPATRDAIVALVLELFKDAPGSPTKATTKATRSRVQIEFDAEPRAVELKKWELSSDATSVTLNPLRFRRSGDLESTFDGRIEFGAGDAAVLTLTLSGHTPEGLWKAPICANSVLLGVAVVEL